MSVKEKIQLKLDHRFDPETCRHNLNGQTSVLHCHHYSTLYTQLAEDCGMLDGRKLLADTAEDNFYDFLWNYYRKHNVNEAEDRIALAEQYYASCGLGAMQVCCAGHESGEVELQHSHLDEGWLKKWGRRERPVNHITRGFIAAMFSAVYDRPRRSYTVVETAAIVSGAKRSQFRVVAK